MVRVRAVVQGGVLQWGAASEMIDVDVIDLDNLDEDEDAETQAALAELQKAIKNGQMIEVF